MSQMFFLEPGQNLQNSYFKKHDVCEAKASEVVFSGVL